MTNTEAMIVAAALTRVAHGGKLKDEITVLQDHLPHHYFYVEDDGKTCGVHKTPRQREVSSLLPAIEGHQHVIGTDGRIMCGCTIPLKKDVDG